MVIVRGGAVTAGSNQQKDSRRAHGALGQGGKMDDLLQFVPEDQRDSFAEVAKGYVKADDDVLYETVKGKPQLFNRIIEKPLQTRYETWKEKELPGIIEQERDRLMKEINPEETPAEKRLRELEQKLADKERKETEYERRATLREQYKDVAPDVAEKLYALDDDSVSAVMEYTKALRSKIDELEKVQKYGGKPPAGGGKGDGKAISEAEYAKMAPKEQFAFVTGGGQIE